MIWMKLLLNSLKHAFFLGFSGLEIWYWGVFEVADYESELKTHVREIGDE